MICKKRWSCIFEYHVKYTYFRGKSFKFAKSRHFGDSKLVRQVHIVSKLLPGTMINHENYFWEITNFVKNWFAKKGDLPFLSIM